MFFLMKYLIVPKIASWRNEAQKIAHPSVRAQLWLLPLLGQEICSRQVRLLVEKLDSRQGTAIAR